MVIGISYEWMLIISGRVLAILVLSIVLFLKIIWYASDDRAWELSLWNELKSLQCSGLSAFLIILWKKLEYFLHLSVWSHFSCFRDNIVIACFCKNHPYNFYFRVYFHGAILHFAMNLLLFCLISLVRCMSNEPGSILTF